MANMELQASQGAIRGIASGVFFFAFFSTAWALLGIAGLDSGAGSFPWATALAIVIGVALAATGAWLIVVARRLPETSNPEEEAYWRGTGKWFGIIFATEGILIGLNFAICNAINRAELAIPITVIIVGAHFLPLAAVFRMRMYYLVGALLIVVGVVALLLPAGARLGAHQAQPQWMLAGFGSALILWVASAALIEQARRLLASVASASS